LADVITTVVPLVDRQAVAKGVSLTAEPAHPECQAVADRGKVDQILLNLLSNAIKFTNSGGSVRVVCSTSDKMTAIAVTDTGIGIPAEKFEAVFEPFIQLGRSLSSAHEGTGLGLAISRDLARAMSGDLTVKSQVGSGSTFTLTLPRPLPETPRSRKKAPKSE